MDLNSIALFVAVAEATNFSEAARKLGVERSAVSRGVAALERELGVSLFARTTRRVALTTAGAALRTRVAPHIRAISDVTASLPERDALPSGELRLTAPTDIGAMVLPAIVAGFSKRYPDVRLDVRLTNRRVDLVAEGFDVALRGSSARLADSTLVARRLTTMEMHVFASPTYLARAGTPRTVAEAAEHAWVAMRGAKWARPLGRPARAPLLTGDDMLFVYKAVAAGCGLGLFPSFLAGDDCAAGTLARVLPRRKLPAGALYFLHPPARHVPGKVTALRDHLVEHFIAHPLAHRPA